MALALAGCATRPALDPAEAWTSGRLSVRVEAGIDRPAQATTADFDLRGDGTRGELRLSTPLGSRLAQLRWSPQEVVLDRGNGQTRFADLDALSRESLGEALPLAALPDWLAGRPWQGAPSVSRAQGFEQLGWMVSLAAFADGRIDAVRDTPPRVEVRVRLERPAP